MFFLKFKKYKYIPSYEIKTSTKIVHLSEKYEPLFMKFISDKSSLTKDESETMFAGVQEVSKYIINGIFYQIMESYNTKSGLEKKAEVLLNMARNQYHDNDSFEDYLEEELMIIAEDCIYEAIGLSEKKTKTFKKESEDANFISYVKYKLFFKVINFLEARVTAFSKSKIILSVNKSSEDIEDRQELVNILLEESLLKESLPVDTIEKIKESLLTQNIDASIKPYIEFLVDYKKSKES